MGIGQTGNGALGIGHWGWGIGQTGNGALGIGKKAKQVIGQTGNWELGIGKKAKQVIGNGALGMGQTGHRELVVISYYHQQITTNK